MGDMSHRSCTSWLPAIVVAASGIYGITTVVAAREMSRDIAVSAETRVDALLTAMGGRDTWAGTRFVHVRATHRDDMSGELYENQIWNDFSAPRVRIEARIGGDHVMRGIDGTTGWRVRRGEVLPLAAEQIEADRAWWESNVYRTLHRLAARDATLTARAVGSNRLEVFREDRRRLNWFVLNGAGEPILFGTWDNEHGTSFGPLTEASSGIRHWRWGASADGTFQFEIATLDARAAVPTGITFDRP